MACTDRPELQRLSEQMPENDVLAFWRLDRLERKLKDLLGFVNELHLPHMRVGSLSESMAATTPKGTLAFQIFGTLAECEWSLNRERELNCGVARSRGRQDGRPW